MALHGWTDRRGWEGLHTYWMTGIARHLRADLPPGYRAMIGSSPLVTIGADPLEPDVAVTNGTGGMRVTPDLFASDDEVAVAALDEEDLTVQVGSDGRLVAVVELISPRNTTGGLAPPARRRRTARGDASADRAGLGRDRRPGRDLRPRGGRQLRRVTRR